jgi:hypothetical protein
MKQILSRLRQHFIGWREWELNPVVVKELRQSVRSWAVVGMLLLFLAVLFFTCLIFLVNQSFRLSVDQRLGAAIFQTFTVILTGSSLAFIPIYVGIRLAAERQESNLDLLYITTLTPERIIRGKFFCGVYMTVLFFSACMPFMVFTNLLRGVDLPTIFFILACLFLVVCAAIQVAIFLACLPVSRLFKILVALFGTIGVLSMIGPIAFFFIEMMRAGVGSMVIGGSGFWIGFTTTFAVVLGGVLFLYYLSVAMISPESSNRALPVRTYVTVIWLLGALLCLYWTFKRGDARFMLPWAIMALIIFGAALIVIISNKDELSLRVRRNIPLRPWSRTIAFLFFNGAAGGLVWLTLLVGLTCAVTYGMFHFLPPVTSGYFTMGGDQVDDFEISTLVTVLYAFAYALTALFLHRRFLAGRSAKLAGVLAILLPGVWAVLPNVVLFFLNQLSFKSIERSQLGSIVNVFTVKDYDQKIAHLICAAIWLLLMVIINLRWFVRQVKEFKPLDSTVLANEPKQIAVPPPLPSQT